MRSLIEAIRPEFQALTPEQVETVKRIAKSCAYHDLSNEREARGKWWVGEKSHALGIVSRSGMIDVNGKVAKAFEAEYARVYRSGE